MNRLRSFIVIVVFIFCFVNMPIMTMGATEPKAMSGRQGKVDPITMVVDLALARPLGLVSTIAGLTVFIVASPLSALGGNADETWNVLVVAPANYTFQRPLGHFDP